MPEFLVHKQEGCEVPSGQLVRVFSVKGFAWKMLNAKNTRGNHPITPLPKASAKGLGKQFHINTARYFLITQ